MKMAANLIIEGFLGVYAPVEPVADKADQVEKDLKEWAEKIFLLDESVDKQNWHCNSLICM